MEVNFELDIGHLSEYERETLYNAVVEHKPNIILEVGAGRGAASFYMFSALKRNRKGRLFSCDSNIYPVYLLSKHDKDFNFYFMNSERFIDRMIKTRHIPDFIFFDGPADPMVAFNDFRRLDPYLKTGTIFSMHDWCTEKRKSDGGVGEKSKILKPYLLSLNSWEILFETDALNYEEGKDSVGMVFAKKVRR